MDRHGVAAYRAVATSAAREASNRHVLVERIRHEAKIDLEVISGEEEARLVRVAVLRALRGLEPPRFILDLGGGSLELSELRGGVLQKSIGLPLGTVRLMEAFRVQGTIHEHTADDLRLHVLSVLRERPAGPAAVRDSPCGRLRWKRGDACRTGVRAKGRRPGNTQSEAAAGSSLANSPAGCGESHEGIFSAPRPRGGHGRRSHRFGDDRAMVAAPVHDHAARGRARRFAL